MKLLSFRRPDGIASWGIAKAGRRCRPGDKAPALKHALWATTSLAEEATRHVDFKLEDISFLPPIPDPEKILCVGLNYTSHIKEGMRREPPAKPIIFTRYPNSPGGTWAGHGAAECLGQFDYEGELAVVIGRRCRHVKAADWQSVVAGYSCYNDGSIREWQRHSSQFIPGKNFFRSGAFGPWIVTPEEARGHHQGAADQPIERQEAATCDDRRPVFRYPHVDRVCSTFTQLEAGDVIATGTTAGLAPIKLRRCGWSRETRSRWRSAG